MLCVCCGFSVVTLLAQDFVTFNPLGRSCGTVMIWSTTEVLMCRKQLETMPYILNSYRNSQVNYFNERRLGQWVRTVSFIVPVLIVKRLVPRCIASGISIPQKKMPRVFFQIPLSLMFMSWGCFPKKNGG